MHWVMPWAGATFPGGHTKQVSDWATGEKVPMGQGSQLPRPACVPGPHGVQFGSVPPGETSPGPQEAQVRPRYGIELIGHSPLAGRKDPRTRKKTDKKPNCDMKTLFDFIVRPPSYIQVSFFFFCFAPFVQNALSTCLWIIFMSTCVFAAGLVLPFALLQGSTAHWSSLSRRK